MTLRLCMVLVNTALAYVLFLWSLVDNERRRTLITYAIWFELASIAQILGAIAIHVGAYPLWNNK